MDGPPAPPPAKKSVGQAEDRFAIELALAESAETEWLQPQPQPSPQPAQFSGQPDEWIQDECGKWWQRDVNDSWWNCDEAGEWHCATAEFAGILAATQGDAAPVAAQLQPQPQDGRTRGERVVDLPDDPDANEKWSFVGGAEDSNSEASSDQHSLDDLD